MPAPHTEAPSAVPEDLHDPNYGVRLTSWRSLDEHRTVVEARHDGGDHPLLLVHAVRQAALLTAHESYGVPRTHHCVFRSLTTTPDRRPLPPGGPLTVDLACLEPDLRRGQLLGATFRGEVRTAERTLGTAEVNFAFLSPAVHRFVRSSPRTPPEDPPPWPDARTREFRPAEDQLLFRGTRTDHIPGMTLARELLDPAHTRQPDRLKQFTLTFTGWTTPDDPCVLQVRTSSAHRLDVRALQSGRTVCEGAIALT
ncbi:AfsA-related hotdog domain-containing protein [Kitasatospora sp. NPDC051984]|uniref:AfsA-related hotdog domain-containing protein n=1 Tax=Kitasatospora sp. NPDC051984 TaxID=3364059 RepID=UPI0037CACF07